jgi:hypothetical protein
MLTSGALLMYLRRSKSLSKGTLAVDIFTFEGENSMVRFLVFCFKGATRLDFLKYINKAPDVSIEAVLTTVKQEILKLENSKQKKLISLAKEYPPKVRALLGALLQSMGKWDFAFTLKETLNPLSSYKLNIDASILPNKEKWRIL